MEIGKYLMRARKQKGLSQEEVANMLNVSRQSVSLWECDQTIPSLENLISISKIYNTSIDVLTGQVEPEDNNIINNDMSEAIELDKRRSSKKFLIVAIIFAALSSILYIVPVLSSYLIIGVIVFSIISMVKNKNNYNLLLLIIGIVLFFAHIFVYVNLEQIYDVLGEVA